MFVSNMLEPFTTKQALLFLTRTMVIFNDAPYLRIHTDSLHLNMMLLPSNLLCWNLLMGILAMFTGSGPT